MVAFNKVKLNYHCRIILQREAFVFGVLKSRFFLHLSGNFLKSCFFPFLSSFIFLLSSQFIMY